jgi:hypothetical protein
MKLLFLFLNVFYVDGFLILLIPMHHSPLSLRLFPVFDPHYSTERNDNVTSKENEFGKK